MALVFFDCFLAYHSLIKCKSARKDAQGCYGTEERVGNWPLKQIQYSTVVSRDGSGKRHLCHLCRQLCNNLYHLLE